MGSPVAIMKLLALTLFVAVASAVPSQQWRKADPLFEHSLTTRNMFSNPLHTVFGVQAKKVLQESRQAILGKSYAPRQPYKGKPPRTAVWRTCPPPATRSSTAWRPPTTSSPGSSTSG